MAHRKSAQEGVSFSALLGARSALEDALEPLRVLKNETTGLSALLQAWPEPPRNEARGRTGVSGDDSETSIPLPPSLGLVARQVREAEPRSFEPFRPAALTVDCVAAALKRAAQFCGAEDQRSRSRLSATALGTETLTMAARCIRRVRSPCRPCGAHGSNLRQLATRRPTHLTPS